MNATAETRPWPLRLRLMVIVSTDPSDVFFLDTMARRFELVGAVVDGERGRQAHRAAVHAQHPGAEPVEGGEQHAPAADQVLDPLAHLPGRLAGEGDGQDGRRLDTPCDEVGDATGDDAGLAAAGPGDDQQGPLAVLDRLALGVVQIGDQG
jgi:hypothetical protein